MGTTDNSAGETPDLAILYSTPWVYVDEKVCAQIQGRTVRAIQRDRRDGIGAPYKRINGKCIRYKVADILLFLESQPSGQARPRPQPAHEPPPDPHERKRGRPRKLP